MQNVKWKLDASSKKPNHLLYMKEMTRELFVKLNAGNFVNVSRTSFSYIHGINRSALALEHYFNNVNYIIDSDITSLELMTVVAFKKSVCQLSQPTTINTFSKTANKFQNNNFFIRKTSYFHNCRLNYEIDFDMTSFHWNRDKLNKNVYLKGYAYEIHEVIAKKLNIQARYVYLQENDSLEIVTKLKVQHNSLLMARFSLVQLESFAFGDETGFFVPPGQPYTQFEKMFMMFDTYVWIAISVTLIGGYLSLQALNKFCSKAIQRLVFGEKVLTTNMNYIGAIFGIGQTVLPKGNFARFLLMMFIILCLVLRTCHQSMLYSLLQLDLRRPEIKTIEEAIEGNYTFYIALSDYLKFSYADFMDSFN